jgi:hypothetical protein
MDAENVGRRALVPACELERLEDRQTLDFLQRTAAWNAARTDLDLTCASELRQVRRLDF